jgi:mono/diheme cytochrome c family protein
MRNTLRTSFIVGALVVASAALAQDRAKVAAGAEVYATHCAACHGERLRATGAGFDLLKLRPNERERFDKAVNDGKGQMPPWGGVLSAEEIDQLWAYVRSRADS